ncbi:hypothetical protein BGX26_004734 [Mortierella sp. AD094]|nr:hypothetical protein BGX26_004734 [Mortierella sp. AD094]
MFKFNVALLAPFSIIVALAIKFRVSEIDDVGQCRIGLRTPASAPLIAYDTLINIWLTFLFVRALISSTSQLQGPTKCKLRAVAHRTLIGAILSLILSTANIASVVAFNGHERGVLCLALCTLDVMLNAVTIHWVTSPCESSNSKISARSASSNGDRPSKVGPMIMEKQISPLESHISVSIESYVEEYHQLHIANKSTLVRSR